jgi:hypothetical protein
MVLTSLDSLKNLSRSIISEIINLGSKDNQMTQNMENKGLHRVIKRIQKLNKLVFIAFREPFRIKRLRLN